MTRTDDSEADYRALVKRGYDACAESYEGARRANPEVEIGALLDQLNDGGAALDIGCGAGIPAARFLAERFSVTGVDVSSEMVRRARRNVPTGDFLCDDIMSVDFPPSSFDVAVALFSIFHLPREEHSELFRRIYRWLVPGGHLLCTLSHRSEEGYTEDDFFGVTMYWSIYSLEEYRKMLAEIGFTLLATSTTGSGYQDAAYAINEDHPLVLAQKH